MVTQKLATLAYIIYQNEVLLLYRNKKPNDYHEGKYVAIGGRLEPGETPLECVIRELKEETGLEVELDEIHAVESCFDDPRGNTILILYKAHITGGELKAGDDAVDVGFFPLNDLPEIAFDCHRKTLSHLAKNVASEENG